MRGCCSGEAVVLPFLGLNSFERQVEPMTLEVVAADLSLPARRLTWGFLCPFASPTRPPGQLRRAVAKWVKRTQAMTTQPFMASASSQVATWPPYHGAPPQRGKCPLTEQGDLLASTLLQPSSKT